MEIKDNYSIFNLFLDKKVKIYVNQASFILRVPTIRDFSFNEAVNASYHLWSKPISDLKDIIQCESSFEFVYNIFFQYGMYREYSNILETFEKALVFLIPDIEFDYLNKQLIVDSIIITEEIWEYVLYVLKLTCGEKVEKPRTFDSEDERQFYLSQKKMEEKIKKIKTQAPGDNETLIKSFLTIIYAFNLSFDYLADQTMAQIQWLQGYAAGAVSYEVNAQAFAAGNVKKGEKLNFFIN